MSEWKSVDSAPKDGTWCMVVCSIRGNTFLPAVARWCESGGIWETGDGDDDKIMWKVTHWMPLPEGPE